ncbi:uncharacterized protein LOC143031974 [Oratosquilla oratoria]|uniref:uncharacterized protein LOC143031974 n=1 Tax=Oratosquilla oratoria TaxID=337810 RepID=UPI003F76BA7B
MARSDAHRKFYDFCDTPEENSIVQEDEDCDPKKLVSEVAKCILGRDSTFSSPFGQRKVVYADYIASGRSVSFIEDYIQSEVLPLYGSTHTTASITARQTTAFRHEARDIIRNAVHASEHDAVMFTGSGATAAVNKLINALDLPHAPIVFVCPFTHHSSLLPWREMGAKVVRIRECLNGSIDMTHLEEELQRHKSSCRQLIGCMTAVSNVTGVSIDDVKVSALLHSYGALAIWDYATAAPYCKLDMNPTQGGAEGYKDAIFFSMHKFVGGVQTPGVLVAKKSLFGNASPELCGGGTVFFVSRSSHRFLKDVETREEGGTPAIVEAIRAGLVMQLKMNITPSYIVTRNLQLVSQLASFVSSVDELVALGPVSETCVPILSFLVSHPPSGRYLHYTFVSAVLNDVYGIQARGGCACAGPYAQNLLGIDEDLALSYEHLLLEDTRLDRTHLRRKEEHGSLEVLRPGFTRINLSYTATDEEVDYILAAVASVCRDGWKLLPQYVFNPETGEWKHRGQLVFKERQWLQHISYQGGKFQYKSSIKSPANAPSLSECLSQGKQIFEQADKMSQRIQVAEDHIIFSGKAAELRWFILPSEAKAFLEGKALPVTEAQPTPFIPLAYPRQEVIKCKDFIWQPEGWVDQLQESEKIVGKSYQGKNSCSYKESIDTTRNNERILNEIDKNKMQSQVEKLPNKSKLVCEDLKCFKLRDDSVCSVKSARSESKWQCPPKNIFNPVLEALQEYMMVQDGDRILVCLSGGKDSLSLLHTMRQYQHYARSKGTSFKLGAVTVDPQSAAYDPRPLIPYLAALGVPYFFEQQNILQQAAQVEGLSSICSFCSRLKRGRLYACARREGYNVLALGQHLDDLAESFIMSAFHNGCLRTMKAHYTVKEGDLRVIRPFVYVREKHLRTFAETRKLPIIPENCPACFEAPKERYRVKQLLAGQELLFSRLYVSLRTAIQPLMSLSRTGRENKLFVRHALLGRQKSSMDQDEEEEEEEVCS